MKRARHEGQFDAYKQLLENLQTAQFFFLLSVFSFLRFSRVEHAFEILLVCEWCTTRNLVLHDGESSLKCERSLIPFGN